jgi:hypothetical protein
VRDMPRTTQPRSARVPRVVAMAPSLQAMMAQGAAQGGGAGPHGRVEDKIWFEGEAPQTSDVGVSAATHVVQQADLSRAHDMVLAAGNDVCVEVMLRFAPGVPQVWMRGPQGVGARSSN